MEPEAAKTESAAPAAAAATAEAGPEPAAELVAAVPEPEASVEAVPEIELEVKMETEAQEDAQSESAAATADDATAEASPEPAAESVAAVPEPEASEEAVPEIELEEAAPEKVRMEPTAQEAPQSESAAEILAEAAAEAAPEPVAESAAAVPEPEASVDAVPEPEKEAAPEKVKDSLEEAPEQEASALTVGEGAAPSEDAPEEQGEAQAKEGGAEPAEEGETPPTVETTPAADDAQPDNSRQDSNQDAGAEELPAAKAAEEAGGAENEAGDGATEIPPASASEGVVQDAEAPPATQEVLLAEGADGADESDEAVQGQEVPVPRVVPSLELDAQGQDGSEAAVESAADGKKGAEGRGEECSAEFAEDASMQHDLDNQVDEALAKNAALLELSRTKAAMGGGVTSESIDDMATRVSELERALQDSQAACEAAEERALEQNEEVTRLQTSKAALQAEVSALRGKVDKEQDQMWAGVDGDEQEMWSNAGGVGAAGEALAGEAPAGEAPALPFRDGGTRGLQAKASWGVYNANAGSIDGARAESAGKPVSEQRLREELARKNEQILELRIQVATMESEMRSTRDFVQMRSEMEIAQVRQESEWQRQMNMQEMTRSRHECELANAKKDRLKGALEGAVTEMRERRRDVEVLKSKLQALSLKFEASAKHLLDENSLLKDLQSVKQGIDALNREADVQMKAMDKQHEGFLHAARWSGDDGAETDDMPHGPQGPAVPKGRTAGKGEKDSPSPGKKGAGHDAKAPSPSKKGAATGGADPDAGSHSHQHHHQQNQQHQQQQQQQQSHPGNMAGAYGYAGYPSAAPFAGNLHAGGFVAGVPRFPLAPMGVGPPAYMGENMAAHVAMPIYNGQGNIRSSHVAANSTL